MDGLLDQSALLVMVRQLDRKRTAGVGGSLMEGGRHAPVQQTAARRLKLCIGYLAQSIMAEIIATHALFAHDTPLPQFIQAAHDRRFILFAGRGQYVDAERATDGRRDPSQVARRR